MLTIAHLHAREILDSRGKPTVEAEVHLAEGVVGRASVPSGASTGAAEACELRDGDPARYDGLGVRLAVENVNHLIGPALVGCDAADQVAIDGALIALDGTPHKMRLGANAILAVSLACCRAAALAAGEPLYRRLHRLSAAPTSPQLPLPMVNMISGGKHAGGNLDFQDVLIQPVGAGDYPTQLEWIVRVYRRLGKLLSEGGYEGYLVGDEGGYGPRLAGNREAVAVVVRAIEAAGLIPGSDVTLALDVAASHFYRDEGYYLAAEQGRRLTSSQMIDRLEAWIDEFPIASIEDGLAESDWDGWRELTARLGGRVNLVGDDLFATNEKLLRRGIDEQVANSVLIKVNQIGTLTETFRTMQLARQHRYACVVSARSGETEDDFLADLAVGTAAQHIKIGSIARSERLAKYNRLLRIAEEL
ncbi:MAG: phosphopyruvate hydratase [Pirellulaceae bacterium]|nr:phosphopyruvate hydratase [Pirellulaceae bacterium]